MGKCMLYHYFISNVYTSIIMPHERVQILIMHDAYSFPPESCIHDLLSQIYVERLSCLEKSARFKIADLQCISTACRMHNANLIVTSCRLQCLRTFRFFTALTTARTMLSRICLSFPLHSLEKVYRLRIRWRSLWRIRHWSTSSGSR
jgi:hypothetical protein